MTYLAKRVAVAVAVALVLMGLRAVTAHAATYTTACPPADAACLAITERLEALVVQAEDTQVNTSTALGLLGDANSYQAAWLDPDGDGIVPAYSAGGEVSGTVALSDADRERLDLAWWGTWAIVGSLLVLMIAPWFLDVMRTTRGA